MQIEPPETIHFPIHSLQELQEQRGGLRVSALGSAALLPLAWSCPRRLESCFIKSFRKRSLSIRGYTAPHVEKQRFPIVKPPIVAKIVFFARAGQ